MTLTKINPLRLLFSPVVLIYRWWAGPPVAQLLQNRSPMVEHTRSHLRLEEEAPAGRREQLELGSLFIPADIEEEHSVPLLIFFHGETAVTEIAAARNRVAAITIAGGMGSWFYAQLFADPQRFLRLLSEARSKTKLQFSRVILGSWSAGFDAIHEILRVPEAYAAIDAVLLLDSLHCTYTLVSSQDYEPHLEVPYLELWVQLARDAAAGHKRFVMTHAELFPGTYASVTECADYLLSQLQLPSQAVLKWGPMGLQQLREAQAGQFLLLGYAGNSGPDHLDHFHALPDLLKLVK